MNLTIQKKKGDFQNSNVYIDGILITDNNVELTKETHEIVIEQAELTEHEYFQYKDYIWKNAEPEERHSSPEWKQYYMSRYTIELSILDDTYLSIEILPKHINEESKECFDIVLNSDSSFSIKSKEYIIEKYSLKSMKRLKIIESILAIPIIIIVLFMIIEIIKLFFGL